MKDINFSDDKISLIHESVTERSGAVLLKKICFENELYFFERGYAEVVIGSRKYRLSQGDIALLKPGQYMEILIDNNTPYEYYAIKFSDAILPAELLPEIQKASGCYAVKHEQKMLFENLVYHVKNYSGEYLGGLLRYSFLEVLYYFCNDCTRINYVSENKAINVIFNYIEENIEYNFNLNDICRSLKHSESYICKEFNRHTNTTLMKYVKIKRILLSEYYISQGKKPNDIYKKCGFIDYSTFYRSFKSVLGRTPSGLNE